jgi:hypothetical protein
MEALRTQVAVTGLSLHHKQGSSVFTVFSFLVLKPSNKFLYVEVYDCLETMNQLSDTWQQVRKNA